MPVFLNSQKYPKTVKVLFVLLLSIVLGLLPTSFTLQAAEAQSRSNAWFTQPGHPIKFLNLDNESGLADNNVWKLLEDSNGFMWFGTAGGLNHYDAYTFQTYTKEIQNQNSLSENLVRTVLEDQYGNFWVGTWEGGLNYLNNNSGEITRYMSSPDDPNSIGGNTIRDILEDSQGRIWVAAADGGLNLYNPEEDNFTRYQFDEANPASISSNSIYKLIEDPDGTIWIGTYGGGLNHFDPETADFTHIEEWQDELIIDLELTPQGKIWIATWGAGLALFDPATSEVTTYTYNEQDSNSLSNDFLLSIELDADGYLWIGTDGGGLNVLDTTTNQFTLFTNNPQDPESLPSNHIRDIHIDSSSNIIWLGTWGGGVSILSQQYNQFAHFKSIPMESNSLSSNNVTTFVEDSSGTLWIGTDGGGLNYFDPESGNLGAYRYDPDSKGSISHNSIRTLALDTEGNILVGTLGGGLNVLDPETGSFTKVNFYTEGMCESVFDIYVAPQGTIWVGCLSGLARLDPSFQQSAIYAEEPDNLDALNNSFVTSILPADDGKLWVGTFGGLHLFSPDTGTFVRYLHDENDKTTISHNNVVYLLEDSKNRIWVATFGGGLNLFDPTSGTFSLIGAEDGIPQENIMGMLEADQSAGNEDTELWISTSDGLVQYFPDDERYTQYSENSGLQGRYFNTGAVYKTAASDMVFGGTNGFNMFSPNNLLRQSTEPRLLFTGFYISFEKVPITQDGILQQPITQTTELHLPHDTQIISFEFTALDYIASDKIKYRYMMEGFEDNWIEVPGNSRLVTFTNLDPGNYVFRVQSSYGNGQQGDTEISLNIFITPPWWQTILFRVVAVVLVLSAISILYYFRLGALERQKNQLEAQIQERTLELQQSNQALLYSNKELESFSYSVSHDLRAPLRAIQGFTQIIAEDHADELSSEAKDYFTRVENSALRMNELIEALLDLSRLSREDLEISWINLSELVEEELNNLQNRLPEKKLITHITPELFSLCDGRLLRIALHNLLENAWKYSIDSQEVEISFGKIHQGGQEVYFVKDNGVGFSESYKEKIFEVFQRAHTDEDISGTGIGLAIVQRIIRKHGGEIWAESTKGEGSTFYFTL